MAGVAASREAELRLRNTETIRRREFARITRKLKAGKLTADEALQLRREFWDDRLRDRRLVRGEITALSSRSS